MASEFSRGVFGVDSKRLESYERQRQICARANAVVYKAENKQTGDIVALKKITLENYEFDVTQEILFAVNLFKSFDHPSLVKILDVMYTDSNKINIVMEYIQIDLRKYIHSNIERITEEFARSSLKQILNGLVYLYRHDVIHRGIKPENILINQDGRVKLTDFAIKTYMHDEETLIIYEVIALWYAAPEVLLGGPECGLIADMWSLGCVFAEMFLRSTLFRGYSQIEQIFQIFQVLGTPNENVWPEARLLPFFNPRMPRWAPQDLREFVPVPSEVAGCVLRSLLTCSPDERPYPRTLLALDYINDAEIVSPEIEELV